MRVSCVVPVSHCVDYGFLSIAASVMLFTLWSHWFHQFFLPLRLRLPSELVREVDGCSLGFCLVYYLISLFCIFHMLAMPVLGSLLVFYFSTSTCYFCSFCYGVLHDLLDYSGDICCLVLWIFPSFVD